MTTAMVSAVTHRVGADTWLVAATGMNKNAAKSTGGYVSYTAG